MPRPKDPEKARLWISRIKRGRRKYIKYGDMTAYYASRDRLREDEGYAEKCRQSAYKRLANPEYQKLRKRIQPSMNRKIKKSVTKFYTTHPEIYEELSQAAIKRWQNKDYAKKCVTNMAKALGNLKGMTSLEKKFYALLKSMKLKYTFVGDGKLVIGRYCPDFKHDRFKWVIETFGSYHHRDKKKNRRRNISIAKAGYKILVVWDYELDDIPKLIKKIHRFHSKNLGKLKNK